MLSDYRWAGFARVNLRHLWKVSWWESRASRGSATQPAIGLGKASSQAQLWDGHFLLTNIISRYTAKPCL